MTIGFFPQKVSADVDLIRSLNPKQVRTYPVELAPFASDLTLSSHVTSSRLSAALRYQLGDQHEFDFVEGSVPWPQAPGKLSMCVR